LPLAAVLSVLLSVEFLQGHGVGMVVHLETWERANLSPMRFAAYSQPRLRPVVSADNNSRCTDTLLVCQSPRDLGVSFDSVRMSVQNRAVVAASCR